MQKNPWLERGLNELDNNRWFDGFQMLQGALQRTIRLNQPENAKMVITESLHRFKNGKQEKLACNLFRILVTNLQKKMKERIWIELIPYGFIELKKLSMMKCIRTQCNHIIVEKAFQDSDFILHINNLLLEDKFEFNIYPDLYFIQAGVLCKKKDYISCFEVLESWSKEKKTFSPKIATYLTLAEINAYEIEGCGSYLGTDYQLETIELEDKRYLEIASRIFKAVKDSNMKDFYSTISDHSDIIDWKYDALLKALCDEISEIFRSKSGSGLFSSLFGT
jgi:hypothetical protein